MDYERELAEIERQLLTQDPDLAAELDTFGDITKARRAPCPPTPAAAPEAPPHRPAPAPRAADDGSSSRPAWPSH